MNVWLGIFLVCFGFLLGVFYRSDRDAAFNRGVTAGYETAKKEQKLYDQGKEASYGAFPSIMRKTEPTNDCTEVTDNGNLH